MEDPSSSRIHIQPTVVSNLLTRKSALAGLWEQGLAGNPVSGQVVSGMEAA